jgi:hypothetical protein
VVRNWNKGSQSHCQFNHWLQRTKTGTETILK